MNFKQFIQELKRRNVIKASITYGAIAWLLLQAGSIIFPALNAPDSGMRYLLFPLIVLFPVWLLFAWIYDYTGAGFRKTEEEPLNESIQHKTGRRMNAIIIGNLTLTIILLLADRIFHLSDHIINGIDDKSIAVLSFSDMSHDQNQGYIADGIAEGVTNLLGQVSDLTVIGRTSSFSFKGKNMDLITIGKKLRVRHILQGSVQKEGSKIRVSTQLINTKDGSQICHESFDRVMDDIFAIQDEITDQIIDQVTERIVGQPYKNIQHSRPINFKAYEAYLKGRFHWYLFTEEDFKLAIQYLKKAIELDSTFALPYAGLTDAIATPAHQGLAPPFELYREAKKQLSKALELGGEYA